MLEAGDIELELTVAEKLRISRRPVTAEERRRLIHWGSVVTTYHPTGKLELRIHGIEGSGGRQCWNESRHALIDQLGDIATGLQRAVVRRRQLDEEAAARRRAYEEEARLRREEEERRRREELAAAERRRRRLGLVKLAEGLDAAEQVRRLCNGFEPQATSPESRAWLAWARAEADAMDPLLGRVPWLSEVEPQPPAS